MAKRKVMFTFPAELIKEPIIYNLSHQFELITNIRQADISESKGWVMLELEGEEKEIEAGIAWVSAKGIRVDPAAGDLVEG
jgi:hypothetical protein